MAASRSAEIVRARDQLHDVLTILRASEKPGSAAHESALQMTSALAAGLSIVVGLALDLNRVADALERIADQEVK